MKIQEIKINQIKPDISQPRKSFKPTRIKEMAQSIKTEGVINAIEIDRDFKIITGEIRWRSAKEAGLKTVPCKILTIGKEERFLRQVIENLHHNTMTHWDTAVAIDKLLTSHAVRSQGKDAGISELSRKVGKSEAYIREHANILEASKDIQKAVKGGLELTFIRSINLIPKEYKVQMKKKVLSGEFKNPEGALAVQIATKRNPNKAKKILDQDYSNCETVDEVKNKIRKVDDTFTETPISDAFMKGTKTPQQAGKIALLIIRWLKANPANTVGTIHLKRITMSLIFIKDAIDSWLKNKDIKEPDVI